MKSQEFPEYTLFLRNILSHISYPKEAEDGEQSNELKIPRTEFQITRHSCRNEAGQSCHFFHVQIQTSLSEKDLRRCDGNHVLTKYLLFSNWARNESPQIY